MNVKSRYLSLLLCLTSLLTLNDLHSQVGLNVHYETWQGDVFGEHFNLEQYDNKSAPLIGLDYWFRLKQRRIEFLPTVYYVDYGDDFETRQIGFLFRATVYPFDLEGDCNCPTFSKEKDVLKKGFFVRLAPGLSMTSADSKIAGLDQTEQLDIILPEVSAAVGVDIGVSNLFTISPEIRYRYVFGGKWKNEFNESFSGSGSFAPGIRLGLRFDEKNYGFKTRRRRR